MFKNVQDEIINKVLEQINSYPFLFDYKENIIEMISSEIIDIEHNSNIKIFDENKNFSFDDGFYISFGKTLKLLKVEDNWAKKINIEQTDIIELLSLSYLYRVMVSIPINCKKEIDDISQKSFNLINKYSKQ